MLDQLPQRVTVYEVGPRDGLQNESRMVPTSDKVALIDALTAAGIPALELTSFVSPRWVPQLGDATEVARAVRRKEGVVYSALVPNAQGLETAIGAGMRDVAVFCSASETHNKKNVNKTIAQSLEGFRDVFDRARAASVRVRAYVSTAFGCPYEGAVEPAKVVELARALRQLGAYQISLGDTIGVGNPKQVYEVTRRVLVEGELATDQIALHLHDTRGTALANVVAGLDLGITTFDSSVGGLGGCPYAPGATGNLATEDLVQMLHSMGIATGIDLDALIAASRSVAGLVGHELASKYLRAHLGAQARHGT